jgi:CHASE3 domain sensor protein
MNASQFHCGPFTTSGGVQSADADAAWRAHGLAKEQSAIDWFSEKSPWLSLWLGFALVVVWGVMSLAQAYDRSLAKVNDSFAQGFTVLGRLGAILGALDRLNVHQRAFLSTGDPRFQDGVIESAETLALETDMLNSRADGSGLDRASMAGLSRSIKQVLASVGESDAVRDARGPAAAVAFFNSAEAAVSDAKWQADQLRIAVTRRIAEIRTARGAGALLQALLYDAPGAAAPGDGAAFSNPARLPGRAATVRYLRKRS